jgi:hypothetical protein
VVRKTTVRFRGLPRVALFVVSLVNLALMAGLVTVMGYLMFADAEGSGPQVPWSGTLSLLAALSVALMIALAYFAWIAYRTHGWSKAVRSFYTLAAAAMFIPFLAYWNLLGPGM